MTGAASPPGSGPSRGAPEPGGAPAPLFIHTGKRTGGTALAAALRQEPALRLWFDPLNTALAQPVEAWAGIRPESWQSGHPAGMGPYFAELAAVAAAGALPPPVVFEPARAAPGPRDEHPALEAYLGALVALAAAEGRRAVVKGEQTEGMIGWLRARFPAAVHIGLVRRPAPQFASWLDQLTLYENPFFFRYAQSLLEADPGRFGLAAAPPLRLDDAGALRELFDRVEGALGALRRDAVDLALDVSPESDEAPALHEAALVGLMGAEGAAPLVRALARVRAEAPDAAVGATARHRVVAALRQEGARAEVRAAELGAAVEGLQERVARTEERGRELHGRAEALDAALRAAREAADEAEARAARVEGRAARLAGERDAAIGEMRALRAERARLLGSASWRLTAPLRLIARALDRRPVRRGDEPPPD